MKPYTAGRGGAPVTDEGVLQAMTSTEAARGEVTLDSPPPWRATAAAFAGAVESGRLDLPPPSSGRTRERWARVGGLKQYCSGARACTCALVTAAAPDGPRLFAVPTTGFDPVPGSWPATGK